MTCRLDPRPPARAASLALLLLLAAGCSSSPAPRPERRAGKRPAPGAEPRVDADQAPLARAEALFAAGDLAGTRRALEEHLDDEPEDAHALYLLGRTLASLGELRGARTRVAAALDLQPGNALAWDLYANLSEALGEHRDAQGAYQEVRRRSESSAPLLGLARCSLYLGDAAAALAALEPLRGRAVTDAWVEYLAFQALKRLGRWDDAEQAARVYLGEATDAPQHAERSLEVRRWLSSRRSPIEPQAQRALVDYVRSACRLRLPHDAPAEEAVLDAAPERLFAFDDAPVFVTLFMPSSARRFFGQGRGKSLAAGLKGAVQALQEDPGYTPLGARDAAVRIDVGRDLERVELRWVEGRLVARPEMVRGVHGLALRADGREAYCLPGDVVTEDLPDARAMLALATRRAGVGEDAWQSASQAVWRFESESFLSPAPGATPIRLHDSEPLPLPEAVPTELAAAGQRGARWLSQVLRPDGSVPAGYGPTLDAFDARGGDDAAVVLAGPAEVAQAAHAFALWAARVDAGQGRQTFLAAARHLAGALLEGERPEATLAQAWTLRALEAIAALEPEAYAAERRALATALSAAPWPAAGRGLVALALAEADGVPDAASERLGELLADPVTSSFAALAALTRPRDEGSALAWAERRLAELAPTGGERPPPSLAGGVRALDADELLAFARIARVAQRRGDARAAALREAVRVRVAELLALQLDGRHRWFLTAPDRALGGFRAALGATHLRPADTAAALRALAACTDLLAQ